MYINSHWTRYIALGCPHGALVHPGVVESALLFTEDYRAERRVNLGDNFDTASLRSKAIGTKDERVPLQPDMEAGIDFLRLFRFTDFLLGNHDIRIWQKAIHGNAIEAELGRQLIADIRRTCDEIDCNLFEHYSVRRPGIRIADTLLLHGFYNGVNATRKTATKWGRSIHAHNHRMCMDVGDRDDSPIAVCSGSLADFDKLDYALTNPSSLSQNHGMVWGAYNDKHCTINLLPLNTDGTMPNTCASGLVAA